MRLKHLSCSLLFLAACGSKTADNTKGTTPAASTRSSTLPTDAKAGATHCDNSGKDPRYEVSEYDTSGDDKPDVRKVFLRIGDGALARLVLVCRESDLNADGTKDIVRYYNEEGAALREEADRNFDGRMDEITFFQEGQILRQEFDTNNDGKVDSKVYFDHGRPLRAERDLQARSTAERWSPDRWEYYEDGRVVRMGTDVDGDGKVDRWDRDMSFRYKPDIGQSPATTESGPDDQPTS
jgi:hypothetical protein